MKCAYRFFFRWAFTGTPINASSAVMRVAAMNRSSASGSVG
jgi:hypothetical protein